MLTAAFKSSFYVGSPQWLNLLKQQLWLLCVYLSFLCQPSDDHFTGTWSEGVKKDRAIFKERRRKVIPEYIVLALPRSIIGLKKLAPPAEPQLQ